MNRAGAKGVEGFLVLGPFRKVLEIENMLRVSQVLATAPHSDQRERSIEKTPGAAR